MNGSIYNTESTPWDPAQIVGQDQATSAHFGMPGAVIGTGLVHDILALPDIAAAIHAHALRHLA